MERLFARSEKRANYFNLTDSSVAYMAECFGFSPKQWIDIFSGEGVLLHSGSGLFQRFEREMRAVNPALQIVSLDPTLAAPIVAGEGRYSINTILRQVTYSLPHQTQYASSAFGRVMPARGDFSYSREYHKRRISQIVGGRPSRSVAALGQDLPFEEASFDYITDVWGPAYYLRNKPKALQRYAEELGRVLKKDGMCFVYPVKNKKLLLRILYNTLGSRWEGWDEYRITRPNY